MATSEDGKRLRGDTITLRSTATAIVLQQNPSPVLFGPEDIPATGNTTTRVFDIESWHIAITWSNPTPIFYDDEVLNFSMNSSGPEYNLINFEGADGGRVQAARNNDVASATNRLPLPDPLSPSDVFKIEVNGPRTDWYQHDKLIGGENCEGVSGAEVGLRNKAKPFNNFKIVDVNPITLKLPPMPSTNADRIVRFTVAYTGSPDTFQVSLQDGSGGRTLVDREDVRIISAIKGEAVCESRGAFPMNKVGRSVRFQLRVKNNPAAMTGAYSFIL